jgi:hypothetical protein
MVEAMAGTVRVSREFFDDGAFKAEPFTEREAFLWMIMEASFKPRERRIGRETVTLERGQLAASVRFMQKAWGWASTRRVHSFICALQKRNMVRNAAGTDFTIITLCNYDKYQSAGTPAEQRAERETERSRNAAGTNENKDEIREEREAKASAPKPARPLRFDEFWDAYPHRDGVKRARGKVEVKYRAAVKSGVSEQTLIDAAHRFRSDKRVRDGFACDPLTWFGRRGWEDEPAANPVVSGKPLPNFEQAVDNLERGIRAGRWPRADLLMAAHVEALIQRKALTREEAARRGFPLAAEPLRSAS